MKEMPTTQRVGFRLSPSTDFNNHRSEMLVCLHKQYVIALSLSFRIYYIKKGFVFRSPFFVRSRIVAEAVCAFFAGKQEIYRVWIGETLLWMSGIVRLGLEGLLL